MGRFGGGAAVGWRLGAPRPPGALAVPCRGTFLENLGEVAGLQRVFGGIRGVKRAKTCPYLCAQLGAARSRQGESKKVGGVGSKRTSSRGKDGHHVCWGGLISRLLIRTAS
jgi:hypothetical protein